MFNEKKYEVVMDFIAYYNIGQNMVTGLNMLEACGEGEVGRGVDLYLLDNRNRTQKWDECDISFSSPQIGVSSCLALPDLGYLVPLGLYFSSLHAL